MSEKFRELRESWPRKRFGYSLTLTPSDQDTILEALAAAEERDALAGHNAILAEEAAVRLDDCFRLKEERDALKAKLEAAEQSWKLAQQSMIEMMAIAARHTVEHPEGTIETCDGCAVAQLTRESCDFEYENYQEALAEIDKREIG